MKDYTIKEKEKFILCFEETEEKLIVHYASGKKKKKKNTEKHKRKLLEKMENQVENAKETKAEWAEQEKKNKKFILYLIIAAGIYSAVVFGVLHLGYAYLGVVIGCYIIPTIKNYKKMKQAQILLKDLEKNEMYLEFDEIREEESIRILAEIREYAKEKGATTEQLEEIPATIENLDEEININSVDKMTYLEMKEMLENAKRLRNTEFFPESSHLEENTNNYIRQRNLKICQLKEEQNSK